MTLAAVTCRRGQAEERARQLWPQASASIACDPASDTGYQTFGDTEGIRTPAREAPPSLGPSLHMLTQEPQCRPERDGTNAGDPGCCGGSAGCVGLVQRRGTALPASAAAG
jgi:hypothetical protein